MLPRVRSLLRCYGLSRRHPLDLLKLASELHALELQPLERASRRLDSMANDACTHYLACAVVDSTMTAAQKVLEERRARAALELHLASV